MSDCLATRFTIDLGDHQLSIEPIDEENFANIVDGDYEAAFSGYRSAHRAVIARISDSKSFKKDQIAKAAVLENWRIETVDLFNAEED